MSTWKERAFCVAVLIVGLIWGATIEKNRHADDLRDCRDTTRVTTATPGPERDFGYTVTASPATLPPNLEETRAIARKGDTSIVPEWKWVDVERYLNGQLPDKDEDTCGIEPGGRVTAIGTVSDQVLVSYEPPDDDTAGTPCDGGEVFFLKVVDFISYTDRAEAFAKQELERKRLVNSLLR